MSTTDPFYIIFMCLAIIAVAILVVVLIRLYLVLTDINETTKITKRRTQDLDRWIDKIESSVKDFASSAKIFTSLLDQLRGLKEKISKYVEKSDTKDKEN